MNLKNQNTIMRSASEKAGVGASGDNHMMTNVNLIGHKEGSQLECVKSDEFKEPVTIVTGAAGEIGSQDSELLQKIAEGCRHSFNIIYEKYWENTYASAYKRVRDTGIAKDMVQEIFTHIWFKRETLQINNLPAYLHVAIRNRVFKQVAREKLTHPFFSVLDTWPSLNQQTDSNLLTREFFKAYEALVNTLPAKKQRIFRLRMEEELSTRDIAQQLRLSRKTVQNQLTRAVEYLRTALFLLPSLILCMFSNIN